MTSSRSRRLLSAAICSFVVTAAAHAASRPNVVLIVADDMGYADLEPHGSTEIRTPQLTRLAAAGVTFTSGYVTHSFCGPSRAGFITGRYQQRFGHEMNPAFDLYNEHLGLAADQPTLAKRLQDAGYHTGGVGYHTGGVGKWHLGASAPYYPTNRGFDYFYGFLGGGHDYFTVDLAASVGNGYQQGLVRNDKPASFEGYLTDALSEDAAQFIARNAATDPPFFLYVAYNAPHSPLQATDPDLEKHQHIEDLKHRTYAAMVHGLDRGVGQILDAIDDAGATDNTLVIFFSDNGGPQPVTWSKWFDNGSSNLPLRGGKSSVYEGGNRVPFMMSWPGTLPAGGRYDRPVIALDAARTAVAAAGADPHAGAVLEGVDLLPFLTTAATPTANESKDDPHPALFWRQWNGRDWSVRAGDLKLVQQEKNGQSRLELFDLARDIGETTDLADQRPDDVKRLQALYDQWNAQNIPPTFPNASDYNGQREAFFKSVPAP